MKEAEGIITKLGGCERTVIVSVNGGKIRKETVFVNLEQVLEIIKSHERKRKINQRMYKIKENTGEQSR